MVRSDSDLPTISVIVPVFNGEQFLDEALQSILDQTYRPLQILVVDDGSTDRSAQIAERYSGVHLLRNTHRGLGATLNAGVTHATGELVAFLDADDRWRPEKLMQQATVLRNQPEIDMVFCQLRQFQTSLDNGVAHQVFAPPQPGIAKMCMLARRFVFVAVGAFYEDTDRHDFLDWYARVNAAGLTSLVLPAVLAERRVHDHNLGRLDAAAKQQRFLRTLRAQLDQRRHRAVTENRPE